MNYYSKLGVDKSASPEEIKRAYKKLAMQHHPDRGGDQKTFQEINEAYDTLKDPAKRQQYDNPQPRADFNMNSQNMNDMFNQFFGRRQPKNQNLFITIKMSLEEVVSGKDVIGRYTLSNGEPQVANIRIPAGVENNQQFRFRDLGDNSIKGLPRGDLIVQVLIKNHKTFVRDRLHLRTKCSINVLQLILGTDIVIEKLGGGPLIVKIPAGTDPGTILSIPGYGLPDLNTGRTGNLYLEIKGKTPKINDNNVLAEVKKLNDGISVSTRR
jgi:DnaJ-class molecular chaperone